MIVAKLLMMKLIGMKLSLLIKIMLLKKFTQLQSALSQRVFKKDFIIGLDIGATAIKLAKFAKKEDGMYLSNVAIIETKPDILPESTEKNLKRKMEKRMKDLIGFRIEVNLVAPSSIPRSEGKAKRVIDNR